MDRIEFTHFDEQGNAPMIDVGERADTRRKAVAEGGILISSECLKRVVGSAMTEGDVLGVARVAGIMGAKRTSDPIPLYHILNLTELFIDFAIVEENCEIQAPRTARTTGKAGVEMEALTSVTVALLTIHDMCRTMDKTMELGTAYLDRKFGGKSGDFHNLKAEM